MTIHTVLKILQKTISLLTCVIRIKKHHSPMELILSAVTSCAAVEIVSMIKKRDFKNIFAETTGGRVDQTQIF